MKLTFHDTILPGAGAPRPPEKRTRIADSARGRWVATMHGHLQKMNGDARSFAADLDVSGWMLHMGASRHGDAVAAVWSAGPAKPVAASVLLAGRIQADDVAALRALRSHWPPLPLGDAECNVAAAQPRPCLATLYLDARWYDNARVELAASALALAALCGPEATLRFSTSAANPKPNPWYREPASPPPFDFARGRLRVVMAMVTKKANAAIEGRAGVHFRVYPPAEYRARPQIVRETGVFEKLKDTTWRVRWYDGGDDRLSFGEFLGFLDQVVEVEKAFYASVGQAASPPVQPQNVVIWRPATTHHPVERKEVRVKGMLNTHQLGTDSTIQRLLSVVTVEP